MLLLLPHVCVYVYVNVYMFYVGLYVSVRVFYFFVLCVNNYLKKKKNSIAKCVVAEKSTWTTT